jgi:D-3-phosphoglycerate dehydrogenase / 2-oxoglutarate reductase
MKILVSAPLNFIDKNKIKEFQKAELIINPLKEYNSVKNFNKDKIVAWMVNPCPEYFVSAEILSEFKDLKIIVTPSTGSTHIDNDYCKQNNITVKTLRDTNVTQTITASSEFTLALFLNVIRNFPKAIENISNNLWRVNENEMRGREVSCLSVGIVGLGRIGGNLARYLDSMGAIINYFDPNVINETYEKHEDLNKMLSICDAVFTCVHVAADTIDMVNSDFIDNMKDNSYYINTSRGEIVVEQDLVVALKTGKIKAAGVDVIRNENSDKIDNNLLVQYASKNNNLIITPHIAGLSTDSESKAQIAAFEMIFNFLKND